MFGTTLVGRFFRLKLRIAALLALGLLPGVAASQGPIIITAAPETHLDPSAASAGRGLASTAVYWDQSPNHWANPALIAWHDGIGFEWNETELVPDLTDGVYSRRFQWSLGLSGIAIATTGNPIPGLGSYVLDYGRNQAIDEFGNVVSTFRSLTETRTFTVGASAARLAAGLLPGWRVRGVHPSRILDVAAGYTHKELDYGEFLPSDADDSVEVTAWDWGFLARITPIDQELWPIGSPRFAELFPLRVDLAYGRATINANRPVLRFVSNGAPNPIASMTRNGWSAHTQIALPKEMRRKLERDDFGWLANLIDPILTFGYASDTHSLTLEIPDDLPGATPGEVEGTDVDNRGWELTLLNSFTIRRGRVDNPDGDIVDDTSGWGIGFRIGEYGGFRYDEGRRPQARGLDFVEPKGAIAWINPLAFFGNG